MKKTAFFVPKHLQRSSFNVGIKKLSIQDQLKIEISRLDKLKQEKG